MGLRQWVQKNVHGRFHTVEEVGTGDGEIYYITE